MTNKYKHDAIVRAWLDGKTVQTLSGQDWQDIAPTPTTANVMPYFSADRVYRIKPTPRFRNVYVNGAGAWKISREAANNAYREGEYVLGSEYDGRCRLCIQEDPQNGGGPVFHPV